MTSSTAPAHAGHPPSAPSSPALEEGQLTHKEILVVFVGLAAGMLLAALNATLVATALPTIVTDLGGGDQISWVITAYLLTSTSTTPLYGKISDLYGRKAVYQTAIVIFIIGSLACGFAQETWQLIAARAVAGAGAGGLMSLSMAIIGDIIPPRERGRYQGYLGGVFAFASVIGPLLGGFFVDELSWRWVFWVNIPVGIAALFITGKTLNLTFKRVQSKVDYTGAALLIGAVVTLLLVTTWGGKTYDWTSPIIISYTLGAIAFLVLFLYHEKAVEEPILPLPLFRNRIFTVCSIASFISGVAMFAAMIYLPLFLQVAHGASPTSSGLQMLPLMAGLTSTSVLSGRIITKTGKYKIWPIFGTVITTVGLLLLSILESDTPTAVMSLYMFVLGIGIGSYMQVLVLASQNAVTMRDLGVATSTITFFRMMGGSIGVAVMGSLFNNRLENYLVNRLPEDAIAGGWVDRIVKSPRNIAALDGPISQIAVDSYTDAMTLAFLILVPISLLGLLVVSFLDQVPLRQTMGPPAKPPQGSPSPAPSQEVVRIPPSPPESPQRVPAIAET